MRILHFCNHADLVGGAEVYAHSLVDALRDRGHEVALFGASPSGEIDRPGLRVIQRPQYDPRRLVRDPTALAALDEYCGRFRPEIIHVHNLFSVALEVVHHLAHTGVPVLQTVHDFQLLCPNSWCVRGDGSPCPGGAGEQCFQHRCQRNSPYDSWSVLLAALRQRLATRAARIALAPSSYLAERLRANGWSDVRELPYFLDFPAVERTSQRSDHEILYVGRLEREKGVHVLLDALPQIRAAVPRIHLSVLGQGSMEADLLRRARRLGIASSVRFHRGLPRTEIAGHYASATLCVIPSVWTENSPLVVYESLHSGLPVVGSRIGGIPELIGHDCGFTFAPSDPQDLARAVLRFLGLSSAERQRMSMAAHERARAFDRNRHLHSIEQIYAELLRMPRSESSEDSLWPALLPILERIQAQGGIRGPGPLQVLRSLARSLGLPKVLRS